VPVAHLPSASHLHREKSSTMARAFLCLQQPNRDRGELAAPALPHPWTYGARIRRFGGGSVRTQARHQRGTGALRQRDGQRGDSASDATGRGPT
jgi:hypothetical protein